MLMSVQPQPWPLPAPEIAAAVRALAVRGLLPAEHYLDSGYPSAALVLHSLGRWGVTLVTPLLADTSHQAKAGAGYDLTGFTIDFDAQHATCPQGTRSTWWSPATIRDTDKIVIKFAEETCRGCPVRDRCTRAKSPRVGRQLTVPPREVYDAQLAARATQSTPDWQTRYARRAGVEGTIRQRRRGDRDAPRPLPRPAQDPARARVLGRRAEPDPARRLLARTRP